MSKNKVSNNVPSLSYLHAKLAEAEWQFDYDTLGAGRDVLRRDLVVGDTEATLLITHDGDDYGVGLYRSNDPEPIWLVGSPSVDETINALDFWSNGDPASLEEPICVSGQPDPTDGGDRIPFSITISGELDLSCVAGWDTATPDERDKIVNHVIDQISAAAEVQVIEPDASGWSDDITASAATESVSTISTYEVPS